MTDSMREMMEKMAEKHTNTLDQRGAFRDGFQACEKIMSERVIHTADHPFKVAKLEQRIAELESALRRIGRDAEQLNQIANFDTLDAIVDTAKNAISGAKQNE